MNVARNKTGNLSLVFVFFVYLIWFQIHPSLAIEKQPEEEIFSIRAVNETLREVLKKISKASSYEIRFNTQLADERISIQLHNVTLKEAIVRVLQKYNHMSLWDYENHIITLIIFKKNSPPVTISGTKGIFELATETTTRP